MADANHAPSDALLRLYQAWADGQVGLILTGNVMVDGRAMTGPNGVVLESDAHLERFHGSFKREVVERMIFFGEDHLRRTIKEFLVYYHCERNHQGLAGQIIEPGSEIELSSAKVCRRERLGGMLNYYYREAA